MEHGGLVACMLWGVHAVGRGECDEHVLSSSSVKGLRCGKAQAGLECQKGHEASRPNHLLPIPPPTGWGPASNCGGGLFTMAINACRLGVVGVVAVLEGGGGGVDSGVGGGWHG